MDWEWGKEITAQLWVVILILAGIALIVAHPMVTTKESDLDGLQSSDFGEPDASEFGRENFCGPLKDCQYHIGWSPGFTVDFTVCSGPYGQQPCLGKQLTTDAQTKQQCEGIAQLQLSKWKADDPRNDKWWIARFSCKAPGQSLVGI